MPSFSTTLEQAIHAALAQANARKHEFATLEHLLLALLEEPDAIRVMRACSVDLDELRGAFGGIHRRPNFRTSSPTSKAPKRSRPPPSSA